MWSPDGTQIATTTLNGGRPDILLSPVNGATGDWALPSIQGDRQARDWSPDGSYILYDLLTPTGWDLLASRIGSEESIVVADSPGRNFYGRFSPKGDWVVYVSSRSGRNEVYLQSFPETLDEPIRVSINGGHDPQWRADSQELYYLSDDYEVTAVPVRFSADRTSIGLGEPEVLFTLRPGAEYEADANGQWFLVNQPVTEGGTPVVVLSDWRP